MKSFARRGGLGNTAAAAAGLGARSVNSSSRPLLATLPRVGGIASSSMTAGYHSSKGRAGHPGFWGPDNPAYATTILCVRKGNSVVHPLPISLI
jgi:hypothetical protein